MCDLLILRFGQLHIYKCDSVKLLDLHIFSPSSPVKAPSTDAIDIDACKINLSRDAICRLMMTQLH